MIILNNYFNLIDNNNSNTILIYNGGEGSGNFDHEGRPGKVGGSKKDKNNFVKIPPTFDRPGERKKKLKDKLKALEGLKVKAIEKGNLTEEIKSNVENPVSAIKDIFAEVSTTSSSREDTNKPTKPSYVESLTPTKKKESYLDRELKDRAKIEGKTVEELRLAVSKKAEKEKYIREHGEEIIAKAENDTRRLGIGQVSYGAVNPIAVEEISNTLVKAVNKIPILGKTITSVSSVYGFRDILHNTYSKYYLHDRFSPIAKFLRFINFPGARKKAQKKINEKVNKIFNEVMEDREQGMMAMNMSGAQLGTFAPTINAIVIDEGLTHDLEKWKVEHNTMAYRGFHPKDSGGIEGTINHELGHVIDNILGVNRDKRIKYMYKQNLNNMSKYLSEYAETNIKEFIAEAWAEYTTSPTPRKLATAVGKIIESKLKYI